MGLCVFDVYEKYYNSKTGGMSNIMGKNPYPLSPQGVNKGYLGFCKLTCGILIHASDIPLLRLYLFP